MAPLRESDIIFSSASSALKDALGELKRTNLSRKNRLRSIAQDAEFVVRVADAYRLPLVANERCGSWYIPPEKKAGSAYFKSTDGHFGQWMFSLRRLNLQILEVVGQQGGCIIVDSTRRGKSMPDALSKTVPIWVAVLNRLLFPEDADSHELQTSMDVVSETEHAQIEARLSRCVEDVRGLGLDVDDLRRKLNNRPMHLTWQRPGDTFPDTVGGKKKNLIVLCTASNQTSNETSATSDYVQGAADDPESWSHGLTAALFWSHRDELLAASEDETPTLIQTLISSSPDNANARKPTLIRPTGNLFIGTNSAAGTEDGSFSAIVSCSQEPPRGRLNTKTRYIHLKCTTGKVGSRQLRNELYKVGDLLSTKPYDNLLVSCETGKDLAVGAALALLCLNYHDDGSQQSYNDVPRPVPNINKTLIKQRLSWIMVSMPDASPSRATLQSVNSFLMG